jgi:myo-inositol-1(or 4)-monophosphatase
MTRRYVNAQEHPMTQSARMQVLMSITQETAQLALSRQRLAQELSVDMKGRLDFVTNADREVEALVASRVERAFPQDGLFGEEGLRKSGSSGFVWIVDPIDGTHNFVLGGRDWAVSIAMIGPDHRAAAIAVPSADLIVSTETGSPLLVNGKPFNRLRHTTEPSMCHTGVSTWMPVDLDHAVSDIVRRDLKLADKRSGSAVISLAAVIMGESDLYLGFGEHIWDVAACAVLAEAAGLAHTLTWSEEPSEGHMTFLCGPPDLLAQVVERAWTLDKTTPPRRPQDI